jgi:hypothetical protein
MMRMMVVAVLLAQFGGSEEKGPEHLRGRYGFSTQRTCVYTTAGFNDDLSLKPIPQGGALFRNESADDGETVFDGKGHTHQSGHNSTINLNVGPPGTPLSDTDFQCEGTYTVENGVVTSDRTCTFQFTDGPNKGLAGTTTGIHLQGRIVQGGRVILGFTSHPTVEIQSQATPSGGKITYERICTRAGQSDRIEDDE